MKYRYRTTSVIYGQKRSRKLFLHVERRYIRQPSKCGRFVQCRLMEIFVQILFIYSYSFEFGRCTVHFMLLKGSFFSDRHSFGVLGAEIEAYRSSTSDELDASSDMTSFRKVYLSPRGHPSHIVNSLESAPPAQGAFCSQKRVRVSSQLRRERCYHWCIELASLQEAWPTCRK